MKTTPWDEALDEAVYDAAVMFESERKKPKGVNLTYKPHFQDEIRVAVKDALTTLSRHGWRLVPAEATEEMVEAAMRADVGYRPEVNAATEAGDVLRPGRAEGGGVEG